MMGVLKKKPAPKAEPTDTAKKDPGNETDMKEGGNKEEWAYEHFGGPHATARA